MSWLHAIIISIVEGLTEFIPVSSTGHMILVSEIIKFDSESADTFIVFIQLGAILAAVWIYRDYFFRFLSPSMFSGENIVKNTFPSVGHFLLACLPIMIGGLLFYKQIKTVLFSTQSVSIALIIGGVVMIFSEKFTKPSVNEVEDIGLKKAFLIGLGQCFALIPGVSRSGATIVTSLWAGVRVKPAADFSFMISVPVMVAAVGYDMYKSYKFLQWSDLPYFAAGFVISFLVAFFSIKFFLKLLKTLSLSFFGLYRIVLGGIMFFIFS